MDNAFIVLQHVSQVQNGVNPPVQNTQAAAGEEKDLNTKEGPSEMRTPTHGGRVLEALNSAGRAWAVLGQTKALRDAMATERAMLFMIVYNEAKHAKRLLARSARF